MPNTNPENLKLTTGRLYWLPSSDSAGFIDFGNVTSYKEEPEIQRTTHFAYSGGKRRTDLALVKTANVKKTFVLDEQFNETIKLICQAKQLSDVVQNAGADILILDASILKLGRSYDFGHQLITVTAAYTVAGPFLIENLDYVLDRGAGMVTLISNAKFGSEWDFEFSWGAVTQLSFKKLAALLAMGTFRFLEFDGLDTVPLTNETFFGNVNVSGYGERADDGFEQFTLEVIHAV